MSQPRYHMFVHATGNGCAPHSVSSDFPQSIFSRAAHVNSAGPVPFCPQATGSTASKSSGVTAGPLTLAKWERP